MSVLTVDQVSKSYFGQIVLNGVSLQLDRGDRMALIGQNGAGKTTLLRLITSEEQPDEGRIVLPAQLIPGYLSQHFSDQDDSAETALDHPMLQSIENEMRQLEQAMQHVNEQTDPDVQRRLIAQYGQLTARFEAEGGYDFKHRMQETAYGLGLPADCLSRPLATLSGGERMRVALARLLLRSPDLLLLDEPTNHLDLAALDWLENYLNRFHGAVMFVTHDRAFMNQVATSVAELSLGRLTVWPGNYSRFLELKSAQQETLAREIKNRERELNRQDQVRQTLLSHRDISGFHAREKVVAKLSGELAEIQARARQLNRQQRLNFKMVNHDDYIDDRTEIIKARQLVMAYDEQPLFTADQLTLYSREKIGICGPNGCGKTTLLQMLLGLQPAREGSIELDSRAVYGHLSQHTRFDREDETLLETVLSRADLTETAARSLLAQYGFRDIDVYKTIQVLSGGEKIRLYLCCLLLEEPTLIFLDEPTNHLDIDSREILEQALRRYNGSILAVSHDRFFIEQCCERLYGFIDGRVLPFDQYDDYRRALLGSPGIPAAHPPAARQAVVADNGESGRESSADSRNPAEVRRENAHRAKRLQRIEAKIQELEQEKLAMEQQFSETTRHETYYRYAELTEELEACYHTFVELSDSGNDQTER